MVRLLGLDFCCFSGDFDHKDWIFGGCGFGIVLGGFLMWGWGLQEGDEAGLQHGDSGAEEGGQPAYCR